MKIKVFLCLAASCLISALIGSVVSSNVHAQYRISPGLPLSFVQFAGDPLQNHGLNIASFCVQIDAYGSNTTAISVPMGKKFIVTDVVVDSDTGMQLKNQTLDVKFYYTVNLAQKPFSYHFQSGIVFDPGEDIVVQANALRRVTISGYWVDL